MWQLHDDIAHLRLTHLGATVDVARPDRGLRQVDFNGDAVDDAMLLAIHLPGGTPHRGETILESYVRGGDLIVRYAETPDRPLESSLYWRIVSNGAVEGIEMLVSMQTELLDSEPAVTTTTHLPVQDVLRPIDNDISNFANVELSSGRRFDFSRGDRPGLLLFRPANRPWSYAEMVHPSDFEGGSLTLEAKTPDLAALSFRLFGRQHLEKGVIRRARLRAVLVARQNDQQAVADCYRELTAAAPPLTA